MKKHIPVSLCLIGLLFGAISDLSAQAPKKEEPAAAGITKPEEVLAGISREVMGDLRPGSRKLVEAAGKASMQTRKNTESKSGTFKMTLRAVEQFQRPDAPSVTRYRLLASVDKVRESGVAFDVYLMAVLDVSEHEKAAKLGPGSRVTVSGKISNAQVTGTMKPDLRIDLMDAKIK